MQVGFVVSKLNWPSMLRKGLTENQDQVTEDEKTIQSIRILQRFRVVFFIFLSITLIRPANLLFDFHCSSIRASNSSSVSLRHAVNGSLPGSKSDQFPPPNGLTSQWINPFISELVAGDNLVMNPTEKLGISLNLGLPSPGRG